MNIMSPRPKAKRAKRPRTSVQPLDPEQRPTAAELGAALATIGTLELEVASLRAQLAEREAEAQPSEVHIRLKDAARKADVPYNRCLKWFGRGWLDSIRRGGRLFVTLSSVVAQRVLHDGR